MYLLTMASVWAAPPLETLIASLVPMKDAGAATAVVDVSALPVAQRMRATYWLKHIYEHTTDADAMDPTDDDAVTDAAATDADATDAKDAVAAAADDRCDAARRAAARRALEAAMLHPPHGSLLRHECAYVLGQLRDAAAQPALETVLGDETEDAMLRHECAEALGGIGVGEVLLSRLAGDTPPPPTTARMTALTMAPTTAMTPPLPSRAETPWEVRQTCEIARDFLRWKAAGADATAPVVACACMLSPFNSHDPAPADPAHAALPTAALGALLLDATARIFERYRALFSLRDRGGEDAVCALGAALVEDDSSPLLRHEVAFVLGQLADGAALPFLAASLRRAGEHSIVRHEAAEALGALETCWDECEPLLREFLRDDDVVIAQSCEVALDAADYFGTAAADDDTGANAAADDDADTDAAVRDATTTPDARAATIARPDDSARSDYRQPTASSFSREKNGQIKLHFNVVDTGAAGAAQ